MDVKLFERMVEDLSARGVSAAAIESMRVLWTAMSDGGRLPCPLCLLAVRGGRLVAQLTLYGVERLKCDACLETIELAPA